MTARRFALLVGALCAACGSPPAPDTIDCVNPINDDDINENGANEMGIHPWHMWGGLATVNSSTTTPAFTYSTTQQLCRVSYKRPESWRFLFFAKLLTSDNHSPATFEVDFNVIPGVGRGSVNLQPFEKFIFKLPIGPLPPGGQADKWSTSVNGPVRDDTSLVTVPNVVDSFVAQDIQISFTAAVSLTVPGDTLQAQVGCLLAPWHHARPDWVLRDFAGEELKGN